jgi:hypothetical protein
VPDKEHPAAKAGRYVRAAGIVLGREVDRRSTAAAAAASAPKPVPAPPAPPPAPFATADLAGTTIFVGFLVSLVCLGLILVHAEDAFSSSARTIALVVPGVILLAEAALLTSNWRQANQRLGQRLLNRVWGRRGPMNKRERAFARAVRDTVTLIGIIFLGGAVYALLTAAVN